jgi:hypothetical protein
MADQVERWFATNGFVSKSVVRHCREGAECDSPGPTPTKNNSATTRPHPRKNWARIIRKLEHHRTARARYRQIGQSQTSKVTAKAPRSPSLRRRQEATGGYRPIAKSLDWNHQRQTWNRLRQGATAFLCWPSRGNVVAYPVVES